MSIDGPLSKRYYTDEYLEWIEILKSTETNPTLKELADELLVMYELCEEVQKDDASISGIFSPTASGEWRGVILG